MGSCIHHVGENGIPFVGVAHNFARCTQGRVGAIRYIVDDLLNGFHLVGCRCAHLQQPRTLPAIGIHGNGPFQRLHGRHARSMHGQMPDGHCAARSAGNTEGRNILDNRVIHRQFAFCIQNAQCKCRNGLAHGCNAEDCVCIHGCLHGQITYAVLTGKDDSFFSLHTN